MYLFQRSRKAKAEKVLEAVPGAVSIAEKVTSLTGIDLYVWQSRFGQPLGTLSWSCRVESQAQLVEATEKTLADPVYIEQTLALYDLFEGDSTDRLIRLISGTPAEQPAKFIVLTEAVIANGKYAEAVTWGAEISEYVAKGTGRTALFGSETYGGFGTLVWVLGCDSAAQVDEADDWTQTDPGYLERISAAGDLFVPASGQRGLIERIH